MKNSTFGWATGLTVLALATMLGSHWLELPEPPVSGPVEQSQLPSAGDDETESTRPRTPWASKDERAQARAIERLADQLSAINTQLTSLTRAQASLRQDLDNLPQWASSDFEPAQSEAEAVPEAQIQEQIQQRVWLQRTMLEDRLRSEAVDSEWAEQTVAAIVEGFQNEELSSVHLIDSTCGSSLCQVDLSIDADIPIEEGMQRLSVHRPWEGQTFFSVGADGVARIYFAREGHELPEVPEIPEIL